MTVDEKEKGRPLRIFNNFCQRTFGTFGTLAKPHEPTHSPSFAKKPDLANPQTKHDIKANEIY